MFVLIPQNVSINQYPGGWVREGGGEGERRGKKEGRKARVREERWEGEEGGKN